MTKLCHRLMIPSVGLLGFYQFPLWRWGAVRPSSAMKQSFLPARSSGAEGHLPADPHLAFLQRSSRVADGANRGNNKVGSAVYTSEQASHAIRGMRLRSSRRKAR